MSPLARLWDLDPHTRHLNHGSFGACPREVLQTQAELRGRLERDWMAFFLRDHQGMLDDSRRVLAKLVGTDPAELVFVSNATAAVNAIVRSFPLEAGDQLLTTNHAYNACRNVLDFVAERRGATVKCVELPLPIESPQQVVQRVLDAVTPATRLALLDHVTSPTAVIMPLEQLVPQLEARNVRCLIDGAHAPGMIPLELDRLGASFYTGNCHKWLCCPKGSGFLHAQRTHHDWIVPPVVSHGWNRQGEGRSRFHSLFDWPGTIDPTPWLCLPYAVQFLERLHPQGLAGVAQQNRELVLAAVELLTDQLPLRRICPDEMLGSMAALQLPGDLTPVDGVQADTMHSMHALQYRLWNDAGIHVPVSVWEDGCTLLRISAHQYNAIDDYQALAEALRAAWTQHPAQSA